MTSGQTTAASAACATPRRAWAFPCSRSRPRPLPRCRPTSSITCACTARRHTLPSAPSTARTWAVTIHAKMGLQQDLKFFVKGLCHVTAGAVGGDAGGGMGSTIVYTPTRRAAEEVAAYLRTVLGGHTGPTTAGAKTVRVACYHAGLAMPDREQAHRDFKTGRAQARGCERWCRRGCVLGWRLTQLRVGASSSFKLALLWRRRAA